MSTRDYNLDQSIDLNLRQGELTTLAVVLKEALAACGVRMSHEDIVDNRVGEIPVGSHLGTMVSLLRRIDAAQCGRKTWNADWRSEDRSTYRL